MKLFTPFFKAYVCIIFIAASTQHLFSQENKLNVIPEVQRFDFSNGHYALPDAIKIKVNVHKNDSLMPIATQLKDELASMFKIEATISVTTELKSVAKNEILLNHSLTLLKNSEAYTLNLEPDKGITIHGASRNGVFWATRTLLQLIENHNNEIPSGLITDYPDYPSRGFMLDVGRKFFTIDYLRDYVKILAYYKMNEFHVHLNDNAFKSYYDNDWSKTYAAFRLESDTYPGLAAEDGHYTKDEFRELQRLGMAYGVNVIPEIDIPAHALAFTRYNSALKASAPYADDHLAILDDEKLPIIYDFFDKLFDEYIKGDNPVFIGPDVHIGTDEYIKEGKGRDVDNAQAKRFREFTNHYLNHIAESGKTPRLWGGLEWLKDMPSTEVKPVGKAVMNAWSKDWVNAEKMLADGFEIISTPDSWLYIVPAAGYYRDFLDINWLYTNYRPEKVNTSVTLPDFQKGLLGSTFAVWNDISGNGVSQLDVHYRTIPALKVRSTKNWKVSPSKTLDDYLLLANTSSDGPSVNLSGHYTEVELKAMAAKVGASSVKFNGKKSLDLGGTNLGYKYDVSFEINPKSNNQANAILFQSAYGNITLNTSDSGRLGFSRDGYTYTFNFAPQNNTWQTIRLVGDYQSVMLYVGGQQIEHLTAYKKTEGIPNGFNFQQTLTFPLGQIGDQKNGFSGALRNLKITYVNP